MVLIKFLKKKRKKKILKELYELKVEATTFWEKSNSEKIKAENFLKEIELHQKRASLGNHYSILWLSCNLSVELEAYQKHSVSTAVNHINYDNTKSKIKLLEEELKAL